jgi:hypothetical protein
MAKLNVFWYERSKLMRSGVVWFLVILLMRVAYWYYSQNVGFSTMSGATGVNYLNLGLISLHVFTAVLAILGVFGELFGKRKKKEDGPLKIADGRYMVKK